MSDKKSSGTIDQMAAKYKTVDDLREYANAQFKQIIELSKKINELEKTNMELTAKLADAENLKEMLTGPTSMGEEFNVDDEEVICIIQLKFLKDKALVRELTMEEVKKTEILVKSLELIRRNKPVEDEDKDVKAQATEELLKFFDNVQEKSKKQ